MQITILGHASVLVEAGDQIVLVDPLFADRFANGAIGFHPARTIHREQLPTPTVIVVTHLHLDHWHPATLETFDRSTPVVAPADPWVLRRLAEIGFTDVTVASPWDPIRFGQLELLPTPSGAEVEEFGLVFRAGVDVYWHMSDSDVTTEDGLRVRQIMGTPAVVATRYQPITPLISLQRGLGVSHDERDGVVQWLEAACVTEPTFLFPYFCDINYLDEHTWANRYARPFAPAEMVALLSERLAASSTVVSTVTPGDQLTVSAPGHVTHTIGTAPFISLDASSTEPFEPFDPSTLYGVDAGEREELRLRFSWWIEHEFTPWLTTQFTIPTSAAHNLVQLAVRWEVTIHLGDGERLAFHAHFGDAAPAILPGATAYPNYAIHIGGRAMLNVLRGHGGNELFWLAAAARVYEKILLIHDGVIVAPPLRGWDLFEAVPEPVSWCLRKHGAGGAATVSVTR